MSSIKWNNIICWALFLITFLYFSNLISHTSKPETIWENYPDSYDYIGQSKYSLKSINFYSPKPRLVISVKPHLVLAPRPFTVPLFLKIANSNAFGMIILQKEIYCLSVFLFIIAISTFVLNVYIKLLLRCFLLYFFTWWNIVGWSDNILSESLSISLMLMWLAGIILYYYKPNKLSLCVLILISIFFSFTRDSWPYFILLFAFLNFIVCHLLDKKMMKLNLALLSFSILLFIVQGITSNIGERYVLPVFNSIVGRVSQNENDMNWFKKEGMPMTDEIFKEFANIDTDSNEGRKKIYDKYKATEYVPVFDWIKKTGKATYQKFVMTHWGYFFLKNEKEAQIQRIFSVDFPDCRYYQPASNTFINSICIFPFFTFLQFLLLMVVMLILFIKRKNIVWLFPILLFILFAFNALLVYNADSLEVIRHLSLTQIILELICITSIAFLIDQFINYFQTTLINKRKTAVIANNAI